MIVPKAMQPALYRAYQFFAAVKTSLPHWAGGGQPRLSPTDAALVQKILPTCPAQTLFAAMPPNDQRHALAVVKTLQQAGFNQPALLQAALLHDVGKSMGQPIAHRVLIVLLEAFWPAALRRLSRLALTDSAGPFSERQIEAVARWQRPFVVHACHPALGAAWSQTAACHPLAVSLIARHQDRLPQTAEAPAEEDRLLAALQWADNLN